MRINDAGFACRGVRLRRVDHYVKGKNEIIQADRPVSSVVASSEWSAAAREVPVRWVQMADSMERSRETAACC